MNELDELAPNDRRKVATTVEAALRTLIDLRLELKLVALDLITERIELELTMRERT
jgi:hypothetical protein